MSAPRRILITGGGAGIGKATAAAFVEAGYQVFVCDIDPQATKELHDELPSVMTMCCDVSNEAEVQELAKWVGREARGLDCLFSNVGVAGPTAPIETVSAADWRKVLDINVSGHFFCAKHLLNLLQEGERSSVVLNSSVAGRLGYALRVPYAASKWATVGIAKSLAKEWAAYGIRVNAVLPGIVDGPRMEAVISARSKSLGRSDDEMREEYNSLASLGRMIRVDEIVSTVMFLCSSQASGVTGQAISVCGGLDSL